MRASFTRSMMVVLVTGTALLLSACGKKAATVDDNASVTELTSNAGDAMEGTTNDVTALEATTGTDTNMEMDANASLPMDNGSNAM